ncbi:Glycosyl transferase [Elusimicrobium minutum Pei191]|uniref:Glycosyl transferase n=1 Tax=Elusimicrobium minutum (strain Pei191) TaxID=445932 RepID=B2KEB1_ELUMP|nr:glycosyltransferase family 2 protein [Elusimicrobium minutum]ACC98857.1 Glycosyl transferase [Elusimicrobium minutum Pei191]
MPKVSIIIPVYNLENYLPQCLQSVEQQTLEDIEALVVDNASTDNSAEIIKQFAALNSKIRILHCKTKGAANARNCALKEASGEYLFFLDGDDWLTPQCLAALYKEAKANDADVTVCDNALYTETTNLMSFPQENMFFSAPKLETLKEKSLLLKAPFTAYSCAGKLIRRSFFEKNSLSFPSEMPRGDDWPVSMKITVLANRIKLVPNEYYFYRVGRQNAESANLSAFNSYIYASRLNYKFLKEADAYETFAPQFEYLRMYYILSFMALHKLDKEQKAALLTLRKDILSIPLSVFEGRELKFKLSFLGLKICILCKITLYADMINFIYARLKGKKIS